MDQCTHEVRAEYWKKDHPGLRAASRRAVSQKLDGEKTVSANRVIIIGSGNSDSSVWTDESIHPNEPVRGNRSGGSRNNRHFLCGAPLLPGSRKRCADGCHGAVIRTSAFTIEITNRISDALSAPDPAGGGTCLRMPAASAVWYWPVGPLICARESMGWQRSSGINTARILLKKEPSSFFCGKRSDRCKGLLWMGTGFLLLY